MTLHVSMHVQYTAQGRSQPESYGMAQIVTEILE